MTLDDFTADAEIVLESLRKFWAESASGEAPVIRQPALGALIESLELARHVTEGGLAGDTLREFLDRYLAASTRLHHPAYLGHQVAVPHPMGALAALVDGFTNNAMAVYEMGPAAASVEFFVVNWLLERVGWRPEPLPGAPGHGGTHGAGVLTHGGSLANLTALAAARSRAAPSAWRDGTAGTLGIIAPPSVHYSIARAAGLLGIGSRGVYPADVDSRDVLLPDRLPAALDRVEADGRRPIALVANACSTAAGLYDPLLETAAFCTERGLWLHVDGAHGASALLSERHRHRLVGVDQADSLVWDAHKMMRTPTLCAAVLFRDHRALSQAFHQEASYLFHEKEEPGIDFLSRTVECTKSGLGLRFFAVLAALGERGLAAYVERQYELAREAYEYVRATQDFECPVEPEANILCIRAPGDDARQLRLRDSLIAQGDFYLTTAMFGGRRYLRLVFMNPETTLRDVRRLLESLREASLG